MTLFNWFNKKTEPPTIQKKSAYSQLIFNLLDNESGLVKSNKDFILEGYISNPIVFRCIDERAKGVSSIEIELHKDETKGDKQVKTIITNSPILTLLNKPNTHQTKKELFKELVINLDSTGAGYLLVIKDNSGFPIQLICLSSLDITVEQGQNMFPSAYIYKKGTPQQKEYPIDPLTGQCDVLCIKYSNPLACQLGLSPVQPSYQAINIFNNGLKFNANLLKNGARPSGILSTDDTLTDEQYESIKESLQSAWKGTKNAGSAPILEGGLEWQELGTSPKDLDFLQGMDAAAMYIASVYGVPFPLVVPTASTFNNVRDARLALFENTIIPLTEDILEPLGSWLIPMFKKGDKKAKPNDYTNLSLKHNPDKVAALEPRRTEKADSTTKLVTSGIITPNEARIALGYDSLEDPVANQLKQSASNSMINSKPVSK